MSTSTPSSEVKPVVEAPPVKPNIIPADLIASKPNMSHNFSSCIPIASRRPLSSVPTPTITRNASVDSFQTTVKGSGVVPAGTSTPSMSHSYSTASLSLSAPGPPSASRIPIASRRTLSAAPTPTITRNASSDSFQAIVKGSQIPISSTSLRDKSVSKRLVSSSRPRSSSNTFVNSKASYCSPAPKIDRNSTTTPNRASKLHYSKRNGRRTTTVSKNVSSRNTPMPKMQHRLRGKRLPTPSPETSKLSSKLQEESIKLKVPSNKEVCVYVCIAGKERFYMCLSSCV